MSKSKPGGGRKSTNRVAEQRAPGAVGSERAVNREMLDRLMRVHEQIEGGKFPNCSTIARDFRVSLKMAGRDLDFMRDAWRFPIDYDMQRHGFFYWEKVTRLP